MTRQKNKNPSPTTSHQVVLRSAPADRRERLLGTPPATPSATRRARLAEVAGGSAAECAAIWCCCPCAIADFVLLAVYRVPAGLCRRALRKRRRRRLTRQVAFASKRGTRSGKKRASGHDGADDDDDDDDDDGGEDAPPSVITLEELLERRGGAAEEMEEEMWRRFGNMGFWRSPSRGLVEEEEREGICNAMQNSKRF